MTRIYHPVLLVQSIFYTLKQFRDAYGKSDIRSKPKRRNFKNSGGGESIGGDGKPINVRLKSKVLKQFFPENYTSSQIEEVIITLLTNWAEHQMAG